MKLAERAPTAKSGAIHLFIQSMIAAALLVCLPGCAQKVTTTSSSISAVYDQSGQHPATATISHPATVSCSAVAGSQGSPIDCMILGPGYVGEVGLHKSIAVSGAGTVQLNCSGQGHCTAVVTQ